MIILSSKDFLSFLEVWNSYKFNNLLKSKDWKLRKSYSTQINFCFKEEIMNQERDQIYVVTNKL
jgi:hypothetical protein